MTDLDANIEWRGDSRDAHESGFLARAASSLASSLDYTATLQNVIDLALELPCGWCGLYIRGEGDSITLVADGLRDAGRRSEILDAGGVVESSMRSRRSESTLAAPQVIAVPLMARGESFGALALFLDHGETDRPLAERFGRLSSVAIDNARTFTDCRRRLETAERVAERNARLHAVASALSRALTPGQVARAFLEHGTVILGAVAGWVSELGSDGRTLSLVDSFGYDEKLLGSWRVMDVNAPAPVADAVRTGQPVLLSSIEEGRARYPRIIERQPVGGAKALAAVPLVCEDQVIGGLAIAFHEERIFEREDVTFLLSLGEECAQALERARIYNAERLARGAAERARGQLEFLSRASAALSSSLDESALEAMARVAVPQIADFLTIDLAGEDGSSERLVGIHVDPAHSEMVRGLEAIPADGASPPWALRGGRAVLLETITEEDIAEGVSDPEQLRILRVLNPISAISIPLTAGERRLGVIGFFRTRHSGRAYTEEDLLLAESLARRIALALDNIRLMAEAREANAAKDRFLATLSHELRNPLATMMAGVELLQRTLGQDPRVMEILSAIERSVRHQSGLVDELLDLSRVSQATVRLSKEPMSLDRLLRSYVESAHDRAEKNGLRLEYDDASSGEGSSLWVQGDEDRLRQVVSNLVSNAIKFTPAGGVIRVRLDEATTRNGSHSARITVADSGVGMDRHTASHLFEMFHHGGAPGTGKEGLGIGLAIARSLVALHGGRIHADSDGPGRGSIFTVELPLISQPAQSIFPPADEPAPARGAVRLLIIEDNRDTRKLLAYTLRTLGYFVQAAASAEEGLEILRSEFEIEEAARQEEGSRTVILADIGLPGLNGYEFLRRARNLEGLGNVIAIAVTGWGSERDVRRAWDAGFNAHFVKPVDVAHLDRKIRELLQSPVASF